MAYADRPAPVDKMAVLEAKLFPGNESMIDCAFFLGSSAGTEEAYLAEESGVETARREEAGMEGLSRAAPIESQYFGSIGF